MSSLPAKLLPGFGRRLLEKWGARVRLKRRLPADCGGLVLYVRPGAGGLRYWRRDLRKVDPALLGVARDLVRRGASVWDIGANVGLFTFAAAGLAGPEGRVLACEPDVETVALLQRSRRANAGRGAPVTILPLAASNRLGIEEFHIARRSGSASSLLEEASTQTGGWRETRHVPTAPLDGLLDHAPTPDVVKIDVEGAELLVLEGAARLLTEVRPIVLVEINRRNSEAGRNILIEAGYLLYDGNKPAAERAPIAEGTPYNTLAVPEEKAAALAGSAVADAV